MVFDGGRLQLTVFPSLEAVLTVECLNEHRTLVFVYEQRGSAVALLKELRFYSTEPLIEIIRRSRKGPEPLFLKEVKRCLFKVR